MLSFTHGHCSNRVSRNGKINSPWLSECAITVGNLKVKNRVILQIFYYSETSVCSNGTKDARKTSRQCPIDPEDATALRHGAYEIKSKKELHCNS